MDKTIGELIGPWQKAILAERSMLGAIQNHQPERAKKFQTLMNAWMKEACK